jgi:hypothetical protein
MNSLPAEATQSWFVAKVAVALSPILTFWAVGVIDWFLRRTLWPRPEAGPSLGVSRCRPALHDAAGRGVSRSGAVWPSVESSGGNAMCGLPTWVTWSIALAVILFSPVLAFLMAIGVEILIGVLKDAGMLPGLPVGALGAIGWSMLRKLWVRPRAKATVET